MTFNDIVHLRKLCSRFIEEFNSALVPVQYEVCYLQVLSECLVGRHLGSDPQSPGQRVYTRDVRQEQVLGIHTVSVGDHSNADSSGLNSSLKQDYSVKVIFVIDIKYSQSWVEEEVLLPLSNSWQVLFRDGLQYSFLMTLKC